MAISHPRLVVCDVPQHPKSPFAALDVRPASPTRGFRRNERLALRWSSAGEISATVHISQRGPAATKRPRRNDCLGCRNTAVSRRAEQGDFVAHAGQSGSHGAVNPCKRTQSNNHRVCDRRSNSVTSQRETRERIGVIMRAFSHWIAYNDVGIPVSWGVASRWYGSRRWSWSFTPRWYGSRRQRFDYRAVTARAKGPLHTSLGQRPR